MGLRAVLSDVVRTAEVDELTARRKGGDPGCSVHLTGPAATRVFGAQSARLGDLWCWVSGNLVLIAWGRLLWPSPRP